MLPPNSRTLKSESKLVGPQLLKTSLQQNVTKLLLFVRGQDQPEIMGLACCDTADDRIGIDCPIGYEGLAVENTRLDGPPLCLVEAIYGKSETLIHFVVLLDHPQALSGELLVRDPDFDRRVCEDSLRREVRLHNSDA